MSSGGSDGGGGRVHAVCTYIERHQAPMVVFCCDIIFVVRAMMMLSH